MAIPPWFVRGALPGQRWLFARPYVIEREGFGQGGDWGADIRPGVMIAALRGLR
jgi:hypothetical protein